jgi:hypothetical protein
MNDECFNSENTKPLERIGTLKNNWRGRLVEVYQHPTMSDKVVTIGKPFEPTELIDPDIICVENKADYQSIIDIFPRTKVYN